MGKINWGILGCGDVTEVKSGPAFNKISDSELLAVMRRNGIKAKDYAERHGVPLWYDNAADLLANEDINAVYIASPPSSHAALAIQSLRAGKMVYLEKPMALNAGEAAEILQALEETDGKLSMAHYRRRIPVFREVGRLLKTGAIGEVRFVDVKILQSLKPKMVASTETNWRTNPEISGGGYFHDLAPHHLDLMLEWFGEVNAVQGFAANQSGAYEAEDYVSAQLSFGSGIQFRGVWCFNVAPESNTDSCTIYGSEGQLEFPFFGNRLSITTAEGTKDTPFEPLPHVQQPMIAEVVAYFLGEGSNPCSAIDGLKVMQLLDEIVGNPKDF